MKENPLTRWKLVDCLEALNEDETNPSVAIESEGQLRQELQRLQERAQNSLGMLDSPDQGSLSFSLGGRWATLGWYPPVGQERQSGRKEAIPESRATDQAISCWTEGIPTPLEPEHLFPAEQVIEAIVEFYLSGELPTWITWNVWNPVSREWTLHPATCTSRPVSIG